MSSPAHVARCLSAIVAIGGLKGGNEIYMYIICSNQVCDTDSCEPLVDFYFRGLPKYSLQMALIRIIGHFKYVQVTLLIVKITSHPEEGTIKVRWRIAGLSNTKALSFWRYRPGKFKEHLMNDSQ